MQPQVTRVGAYAVCVRDHRLLLVHQAAPGPAAGKWTLPGGGIEFGESPADAVRREVREEVGATAFVDDLLGVHDNVYVLDDGVRRHGIRLLFSATVSGRLGIGAGGEIDDLRWHSLDELPDDSTDWAILAGSLAAASR